MAKWLVPGAAIVALALGACGKGDESHTRFPPPEPDTFVGLSVKPFVAKVGGKLRVAVVNGRRELLIHGLHYGLERWDGEGWRRVAPAQSAFPSIGLVVRPGHRGKLQTVRLPEEMAVGEYRISKSVTLERPEGRPRGRFNAYGHFDVR